MCQLNLKNVEKIIFLLQKSVKSVFNAKFVFSYINNIYLMTNRHLIQL